MTERKIIVAGNKNHGLAEAIYRKYPSAKFCSRSNGGYNFYMKESIEKFAVESLDYDVCVFCSSLYKFFQVIMVEKTWTVWDEHKKRGHFIVFGSTADSSQKVWLYPVEKRALRDFCRSYGKVASGGGPDLYPGRGIKITYIAPGMLDTPQQREKKGLKLAKLDPDYVVSVMDWILNQPDDVNIYDISMDPVQK